MKRYLLWIGGGSLLAVIAVLLPPSGKPSGPQPRHLKIDGETMLTLEYPGQGDPAAWEKAADALRLQPTQSLNLRSVVLPMGPGISCAQGVPPSKVTTPFQPGSMEGGGILCSFYARTKEGKPTPFAVLQPLAPGIDQLLAQAAPLFPPIRPGLQRLGTTTRTMTQDGVSKATRSFTDLYWSDTPEGKIGVAVFFHEIAAAEIDQVLTAAFRDARPGASTPK